MKTLAAFLIGLLLAPLAGALGSFLFMFLSSGVKIFYPANPEGMVAFLTFGAFIGTCLAAPVTMIVLPLSRLALQISAVDDRGWLPAIGFVTGLFPVMVIVPHPVLMLSGGIAGCLSGLALSRIMRIIDPPARDAASEAEVASIQP